jgi:hypothetical protein
VAISRDLLITLLGTAEELEFGTAEECAIKNKLNANCRKKFPKKSIYIYIYILNIETKM